MNDIRQLTQKIKEWAIDRELHTAKPRKQLWKLVEENGELAEGVLKKKPELIEDAVGDMTVVMTIMLMQLNADIDESLRTLEDWDENEGATVDNDRAMSFILDRISVISYGLFDVEKHPTEYDLKNYFEDKVADILKGLHWICQNHELNDLNCVETAYNEIKNRKGKTIDGSFIKESDLN